VQAAYANSLSNTVSEEARNASDAFSRDHLCRWVPQFIADLKAGATMDSYRMLWEVIEKILAE
jgi:TorA maturation chaperone TorD